MERQNNGVSLEMVAGYRPAIESPYPASWAWISDLRYRSRLVRGREPTVLQHRKTREASYITIEPYTVDFMVDGARKSVTVPAGMLTDLTSVPRLVRNIVGRVGPHLEAAIVHDYLYVAWQLLEGGRPRRQDWRFANAVMFAGLRAAKVKWFQRKLIRAALKAPLASWSVYRGRDDGEDGLGLFVKVSRAGEGPRDGAAE
jgi:hypothetical protein